MMFSSGKYDRLTDPEPWALRHYDGSVQPRSDHPDFDAPEWFDRENRADFVPRPEFDRPLTNPANPILRFFRDEVERWGNPAHGDYEYWLSALDAPGRFTIYGITVEADQIDHARRVLIPLAALVSANKISETRSNA